MYVDLYMRHCNYDLETRRGLYADRNAQTGFWDTREAMH